MAWNRHPMTGYFITLQQGQSPALDLTITRGKG